MKSISKQLIFVLLLVYFFISLFSGCSINGVDTGLVGSWELTDYSGSGNTEMDLDIDKDDSYKWIIVTNNSKVTKYGDLRGDVTQKSVSFEYNGIETTYSYSIFFDTLELSSSVYKYTFKRVSY